MEWHQQVIKYDNFKGEEKIIGVFWINEDGEVDKTRLPSDTEIAEMLKIMRFRDLKAEGTGKWSKE